MTEEDAREIFTILSALLNESGFSWVVRQVSDAIGSGQVKEVVLKDQLPLQQQPTTLFNYEEPTDFSGRVAFATRSDVRKKGSTRYLKVSDFSQRECLLLLINGIDKAIVEGLIIKTELASFFKKEASQLQPTFSTVEFLSEKGDEQVQTELHFDHQYDSSAKHLRNTLNMLRREINRG